MQGWAKWGLLCVLLFVSGAASSACRQALALGLDVSGSVNDREYQLQFDGLAFALNSPSVRSAILASPQAPIRLAIYEWSGTQNQSLVLDWVEIATPSDLDAAIAVVAAHNRFGRGGPSTALGTAIAYGAAMLRRQPDCWKRTLDISGDGKSNTGPRPQDISRSDKVTGITVNGLIIVADANFIGDAIPLLTADLRNYFERNVISGPNAFVEAAIGFEDFENAMTRKLLRELENLAVSALDQ